MRALRLFLILSLMLTGFALASARGQAVIGERVVLCSGHVVVLTYGPDGTPTESPHFCPDMALALLAALAAPAFQPAPLALSKAAVFTAPSRSVLVFSSVAAKSRDPPLVSPA